MKIVVIGGTGLIGSKIVPLLRQRGHQVVAAPPHNRGNSITGEGPPNSPAPLPSKGGEERRVGLPPGFSQPTAADDVAAITADVALAAPRNGIIEIAGPERAPFNEIVARYLKALGEPRVVVSDPEARYWGGRVEERSLVPLGEARLGRIGLDEWLRRSQARA